MKRRWLVKHVNRNSLRQRARRNKGGTDMNIVSLLRILLYKLLSSVRSSECSSERRDRKAVCVALKRRKLVKPRDIHNCLS